MPIAYCAVIQENPIQLFLCYIELQAIKVYIYYIFIIQAVFPETPEKDWWTEFMSSFYVLDGFSFN